jgi:hypothetical protein
VLSEESMTTLEAATVLYPVHAKLDSTPSQTKQNKFYILTQDQYIKPSLSQVMDRILEKLFIANIKGDM